MELDWKIPAITEAEACAVLEQGREAITYVVDKFPVALRPAGVWGALLDMSEQSLEALCEALAKDIKEGK